MEGWAYQRATTRASSGSSSRSATPFAALPSPVQGDLGTERRTLSEVGHPPRRSGPNPD